MDAKCYLDRCGQRLLWCAAFIAIATAVRVKNDAKPSHHLEPDHQPLRLDGNDDAAISSEPCSTSPCLNGGTCFVTSGGDPYKCKCTPYYTGSHCATERLTDVARSKCGTNCTVSSTDVDRDCLYAIDGSGVFGSWWSTVESDRVGAWYRLEFEDFYRIQNFMFFAPEVPYGPASLSLRTSDDRSVVINSMCVEECGCFWQHFDLVPTITNFLHIDVTTVCDAASTEHLSFHGITVNGNDVPLMNAAVLPGVTCSASSVYHPDDYGCEKAFDSSEFPGAEREWRSNGEGVGAWIQINLDTQRVVMAVGFLQRCSLLAQNSDLLVAFSDGSSQNLSLECFTNTPEDCGTQHWQQYDLITPVFTTFVRVTITGVCTSDNNGFREIRVFSTKNQDERANDDNDG